ncbi:hypothetical protein [Pacificispira sp.]|uniref:hypothetical protein n=1 Tax=Pacificispira sp. TaxID=2888761 RepID=UPI003BAD0E83
MTIRHKILRSLDAHRRALGLDVTPYSREATGDPKFLANLARGRGVSFRSIEKAEEFLRRDPAGLDLSATVFSSDTSADRAEALGDA